MKPWTFDWPVKPVHYFDFAGQMLELASLHNSSVVLAGEALAMKAESVDTTEQMNIQMGVAVRVKNEIDGGII